MLIGMEDVTDSIPLVAACREGNTDQLKSLLHAGWNLQEQDERGRSGLHWAVARGSEEMVRQLLDGGAEINTSDKLGNTPLHYAGHTDVVQCLFDYGANIHARNIKGDTPVQLMQRRGVEKDVLKLSQRLMDEDDQQGEDEAAIPLLNPARQRRQVASKGRKLTALRNVWFEFCSDLGAERLVLVLITVLCLSIYLAYIVTSWAKKIDTRILVDDETYKIEL